MASLQQQRGSRKASEGVRPHAGRHAPRHASGHKQLALFNRALHDLLILPDGTGGWNELPTVESWRARDRHKTVAAALVLCLNVGVDPPDVVKPEPCARLECWLDPSSMPAQKALEAIGKALQAQYESALPAA